jgi:hypothetical protein
MYAAVVNPVAFPDVEGIAWAEDGIAALAARGIAKGVGDDRFAPAREVTRAEFLHMLIQALDLTDEAATSDFADAKEGEWYYASVASAQKLGITSGKSDGVFGVNDSITREEVAVMLDRAARSLEIELGASSGAAFADRADISAFAIVSVGRANAAGLVDGMGDGTFAPKGATTRAQAAVVIHRLIELE